MKFAYLNFDIRMFVLRFSISVQVTKKMIGMIKDEGGGGGGGDKKSIGAEVGLKKKLTSGGDVYLALKINKRNFKNCSFLKASQFSVL